jgi:hypothetical protein
MRADVSCAADDQYFHFFTFIIYGYDKEKFCRWANFLKIKALRSYSAMPPTREAPSFYLGVFGC